MTRRRLMALLGGAAIALPLAARAQQGERMRRIGVLLGIRQNDPEAQSRVAALRQTLQELGWAEGANLRIDYRWTRAADEFQAMAAEIVALAPDVVLTGSTAALRTLQQATRTIPIVFVQVPDPVRAGYVASLARPGGNITGFTSYEHTIGSKWLGLLKEAAPSVRRVAVLINPLVPDWSEVFARMEASAPALGVQLSAAPVADAVDVERSIAAAAGEPDPGMIVLPGPQTAMNRAQIIASAARLRLPAVYPYRYYVASGGVLSYGIDTVHLMRQAASYVDRILKGEKPAALPVQAPTRFELVINLQSARALGFDLPPTLLARADEVVE